MPKNSRLKIRPTTIETGILAHAEGSALIKMGNTHVMCAASVERGKPRWMKNSEQRGWVTAEYSLLPRSTSTRTRRERKGLSGRTQEIQRLIGRSLRAVTDLSKIPDLTVIVDCDVIQADGGTRTAAVTGGFVALCDAVQRLIKKGDIEDDPVTDMLAAISVGVYEGELWLDLDYVHDKDAEVDMNIVMTGSGQLVEVQGTAEGKPFSRTRLTKLVDLAAGGIEDLMKIQKKALGRK